MRVSVAAIFVLMIQALASAHSESVYRSSGDAYVDQMIGFELNLVSTTFRLVPDFYFIDDSSGPNAFATTEGALLLGLELMRREIQEEMGPMGNYSVFTILAHEAGHLATFQRGLHRSLSGPQMEIAADFLAGWYMAKRSGTFPTDALQGIRSLYRKGDYEFNNPNHHGTPDQRAGAFVSGTSYPQLSIEEVMRYAVDYAQRNAPAGQALAGLGSYGCALVGGLQSIGRAGPNQSPPPGVAVPGVEPKNIGNLECFLTGGC